MKRLCARAFVAIIACCLIAPTLLLAQDQPPKPEAPAQQAPGKNRIIARLESEIAGRENEPAEKVWKNIKIFKGMPAIRVLRVMEFGFSPALGVKCSFCHVREGFEKDEKAEKETARKMWKFAAEIRKDLHKITDDKANINCYTCHRGQTRPALNPEDAAKKETDH